MKAIMFEEVTQEFQESVCKSFNTNLEQVRKDVQVLKEWTKSQLHLPQCSSDAMLTTFLIACKNRMERAKEKIDNYYKARAEIPDFFSNRNPEDPLLIECVKEIRLYTLPRLTPDGCRVTMASFVTGDPSKYDLPAFSRRIMMIEDLKLNHDSFTRGYYFVFDANHFSMGHVFKLTPSLARKLIHCAQDVLPIIIKAVVFINAPSYMELVLNIIKPFMKGKLFQKFHIHSEGPEILEKYFPKDMLPQDYGGKGDTQDTLNEEWLKIMIANREWFLKEGSEVVDESKRVRNTSKSKKNNGLEEIQGSFKTLCVD